MLTVNKVGHAADLCCMLI